MDFQAILYTLPAVLIGLTVHEYAHAFAAVKLGDPLPKEQGRLSLNPLVHIDPVGFLLLLVAGFGWAKPVQVNPAAYRHTRLATVIVALAGVVTNFLFALVFLLIVKLIIVLAPGIPLESKAWEIVSTLLSSCISINLVLCIFNLLPLPPLDGSHLVTVLIPASRADIRRIYERAGVIILVGLILAERFTKVDLLPIGIVVRAVFRRLVMLFGLG